VIGQRERTPFERKKQNPFAGCVAHGVEGGRLHAEGKGQKFFGSFFKKEHLAFLFLPWIGLAHAQSAGERLYRGIASLTGNIAGHTTAMPASVLACTNCHVGGSGNAGSDSQAAPDLRGGWLSTVRSRRNGPAARYTQITFCRTLRTGIDPVYIILPVQMPRFAISDADCAALWTYLNATP
jgi:hypothetical protein